MKAANDDSAAAAPMAIAGPPVTASEVAPIYRYWQRRTLLFTIIGYALYYFVRKNLNVAMPVMERELGFSKAELGGFLTAHGLLYGISKFVNGMIGDRVNARWFMTSGLAVCALINIQFGLSSSLLAFGLLWAANGWFQGIGFPPCARLMTHWFPPRRFASNMAVWNTSHSLGTIGVLILCAYLAPINWRLCFLVPAAIVLVGALGLVFSLRDTPESLGLPPVEQTDAAAHNIQPPDHSVSRLAFANPIIWLLSFANFFVYVVRYGILDWGPTFLKEARGIELAGAAWLVAAFELSGMFGMLTAGWITDRFFAGRAARACLVYMSMCTVALLLFWMLPHQTWLTSGALLCWAGFFIYGPQSLVGTAAANLATKRAAASAVGLTGLFGYASTLVTGIGIGWMVDHHGWNAGFLVYLISALAGMLMFAACWTAQAHGYVKPSVST
jgi:OPA family glycerol-3-phosphate transporter-like MFS transporter/OPA family sugar phosphate sensor protein UhpC-like MFS transporter